MTRFVGLSCIDREYSWRSKSDDERSAANKTTFRIDSTRLNLYMDIDAYTWLDVDVGGCYEAADGAPSAAFALSIFWRLWLKSFCCSSQSSSSVLPSSLNLAARRSRSCRRMRGSATR